MIFTFAKLFIALISLSFSGFCFSEPSIENSVTPDKEIHIGVSGLSVENYNNEITVATLKFLETHLGDRLKIHRYSVENFYDAVRLGKVDFTISSAGLYRACERYGAKDIASAVSDYGSDPNHCSSSLMLVHKDRTDLKRLPDLKGLRVAATRPLSITGLVMALGEISASGYDPDHFFSSILYTNYPMSGVIDAVVTRQADVGMVWACFYEELKNHNYPGIDQVVPFNTKSHPTFRCKHSTATYPGHTIALTPRATPESAKLISQLVLAMPETEPRHFRWAIATDFHGLDQLFKATKYGPYSYLREWTVRRIWDEYSTLVLLLFAALIFWCAHTFSINRLVRVQKKMLQTALNKQHRILLESRKRSERIEVLERMGVVQQLSSMIAHELKQPLTAMALYTNSLLKRLEKKTLKPETIRETLVKIQSLNEQSNHIIDHVRGYAKQTLSRVPIELEPVIKNAVQNFLASGYTEKPVDIHLDFIAPATLVADSLEIELIVVNLIKNASDALLSMSHDEARIMIELEPTRNKNLSGVVIRVSDNGPRLSDNDFSRLCNPFHTSKPGGLGLGLAIVKRIAESYGGDITFKRLEKCGLCCSVTLFNTFGS